MMEGDKVKRMRGVCVPMVTPMTEQEEIDYDSLKRLTKHLIERGVSALYPCGTTGEVNNLTLEERKKIVKVVVEAAEGKIPVFAQIGGRITAESMELARQAFQDGADGLGLLSPTYYHLSDEELLTYFYEIAHCVPENFPIYLYGIPGCAANTLSQSLVEKVAQECPNVLGIKYSVGSILDLMAFQRIRNHEFDVLVAPTQMLLPALAAGMCGTVSGTCNVFPELMNEMIRLFEEHEIEKCRILQDRIALLANGIAVKEAAKCKALLKRKGVISSDCMRSPQQGLTEKEREELFQFFDENLKEFSFKK